MSKEEYLYQIAQLRHELHLMHKQHEEEVTDLKKELLACTCLAAVETSTLVFCGVFDRNAKIPNVPPRR